MVGADTLQPNKPMHQSGAVASKEALSCAVPSTTIRLSCGALQCGSPAGDGQIR
jgi:hypothetical protein